MVEFSVELEENSGIGNDESSKPLISYVEQSNIYEVKEPIARKYLAPVITTSTTYERLIEVLRFFSEHPGIIEQYASRGGLYYLILNEIAGVYESDTYHGGIQSVRFSETVGSADSVPSHRGVLSSLTGIVNRILPEVVYLNWNTATDWNNATSEKLVTHPNTSIEVVSDFFDGFEDGDFDGWEQNTFSIVETRTLGEYSVEPYGSLIGDKEGSRIPPNASGGVDPRDFEFYWNESSNSHGGGVRLFNSNGNVEMGAATNNPQWIVDSGNGMEEVYYGDGYDRWIRVRVYNFDFDVGTFDVTFEDQQSGSTTTVNRPLKQGVDIEKIQVDNHDNYSWQGA